MFVVYDLRETYHEFGEYEFKVVLDPKFFKNSHESDMSLDDSDGRPMRFSVKKWGRKMNCSFVVDHSVADGVSSARLFLKSDDGDVHQDRVTFWIIKP